MGRKDILSIAYLKAAERIAKVLAGDSALYDEQWKAINRKHQMEKDLSGAEYISGFGKEDHLLPVLNLVIYFGEKEWDRPMCLKDMMDLTGIPERIQEEIADYPIHLIEVRKYPHLDRFRTDLKCVFGFLHYSSDPEKLMAFIDKNKEEFSSLPQDAFDLIAVMSNAKNLKKIKKGNRNKEEYDMCQAIDMLVADGEERGEKQGIQFARKVFLLYMQGREYKEIAQILNVSENKVKSVVEGDAT